MGIIQMYNLEEDQVRIFFLGRRYNRDFGKYKSEDLSEIFKKTKNLKSEKSWIRKKMNTEFPNKQFDDAFSEFMGEDDFIFYICHVFEATIQRIIKNKRCKQVNFIEEGMMSYYFTNNSLPSFYGNLSFRKRMKEAVVRILYYFGISYRFSPKGFYENKVFNKKETSIFYGLTDKSFSFVKGRIIKVPFPQIELDIDFSFPKKANLLILDNVIDDDHVILGDKSIFFKSLNKITSEISSEILYIKFHPCQNKSTQNIILEKIGEYKNIIEVPNNVIIEKYFASSSPKTFNVYGHISSLLFYAKEFNQNVKSFNELLLEDKIYNNYMMKNYNFYSFFKKNIQ